MVQAGTVLARQGEHCDKLLLIDLGTCTLMFDPTLAARAQALTSISQQTRGLSPTLPDRLGAVPSHSHGHTQSFTGGFHSHNNKAEADLRASEALLTLGPGSLVGDACVLLGQAQMVVSAVATTDVALYAVAGGAFVRRLGAEARQVSGAECMRPLPTCTCISIIDRVTKQRLLLVGTASVLPAFR